MRKIYQINDLANRCGYFYNACIEENFTCNNGYNCRHPQQEEKDINEESGKEVGNCFTRSCPLGYKADEEDFANPEIDQSGYTEWEDCEFIVVDDEKFALERKG